MPSNNGLPSGMVDTSLRQKGTAAVRQTNFAIGSMRQPMFWLSVLIVFLTFTLSQNTLNLFINYSITGGRFFSKFHPATYVAVLLLLLMLMESTTVPVRVDRHLLKFFGIFSILACYVAARGRGAFAAAITDIYITPVILLLALSRLSTESVRKIAALFVWIAAINAGLVIVDFLRGAYTLPVFPFLMHEQYFRPAGLTGHPTQAAAIGAYALLFVLSGAVESNLRRPLMLLLFLSVVLCKERAPLAMSGLVVFANLFRPLAPRQSKMDYVIDFGMVLIIPVVVVIAYFYGALDRILGIGIWETSSQSRILIYNALSYLSENEFMNGVSKELGVFLTEKTINSDLRRADLSLRFFRPAFPLRAYSLYQR